MAESMLDGVVIDVDAAAEVAKAIRSPELRPIAEVFARNVDQLLGLLALPLTLLTIGASRVHNLVFFVQALVRTKNVGKWREDENARAEVEAKIRDLQTAAERDHMSVDEAEEQLKRLLVENRDFEASARALLYSGCWSAWSLLECAAKDAWIAALNMRSLQLGQSTLSNLPDGPPIDGLSGRQVSIGLLARCRFDLRGKLGTLLAPKFDFTSVQGIRTAYETSFGGDLAVNELLSVGKLSHLEATRHLLVHRAGLVDDEYVRRTGDSVSVGTLLVLTGAQVSELANSAVAAGVKLLQCVDSWLVDNPPPEAETNAVG
jgi:hypothetical protein